MIPYMTEGFAKGRITFSHSSIFHGKIQLEVNYEELLKKCRSSGAAFLTIAFHL